MRIVFMGTPDFAVPCLSALLEAGHEICAVFTQPDKPKGRRQVLSAPPVKELALSHGLSVRQPGTLRDGEAAASIRALRPDLIVVAAYGKLLPKEILDLPPYGCVNVHASLLPKYRGAAPIQWAVINGEQRTGVTTMQMGEGLDTGDILLMAETQIGPEETGGELFGRLSGMGAALLLETVARLGKGDIVPVPQNDAEATYAPMLKKETGRIDWRLPAARVHDLVRGLCPWPVAWTELGGRKLKVFRVRTLDGTGAPGEAAARDGAPMVYCGQGAVELEEVQPENGRRMSGREYLRGHPLG